MPNFTTSVAWVTSSLGFAQVLRLVQAVVVARWLGPTEMGIYAYAYSILTLIELLRAIGAEQVYIARSPNTPEQEETWLSGCWYARLMLALLVSVTMVVIGYALMEFFGEVQIGKLIMLLGAIPPLFAVRSSTLIHFHKAQKFRALSIFEFAAAILQSGIPIAAAYYFRTVESLVLANILAMLIVALVSQFVFPMRFRLTMPAELRAELFFFGRNNIATSAMTSLHTNLDNIVIGSFIGRTQLGLYSTGYRLGMASHGFLKPIADRILSPHYRRVYDIGLAPLVLHWKAAYRFLSVSYAALLGGMIVLADPAVAALLGEEWSQMPYVLVFTCLIAYFRGMAVTISPLLPIFRAPHIDARFKMIEVAIFASFVIAGAIMLSIEVFLWGGLASYLVAFLLRLQWWTQVSQNTGWRPLGAGEMLSSTIGLGALGLALLVRFWDFDLRLSLILVGMLAGIPAIFYVRNLRNKFMEVEV